MGPDEVMRTLLEGNARFVCGERAPHDFVRRRQELLAGQRPLATVLTCSDSRVVPEFIFDVNLGDIFDVESAGNVADRVGLDSIEFGVDHLETPVLLILGHTRCGAVTACCNALAEGDERELSTVLERIRGAAVQAGLDVERAVEENLRSVRAEILGSSALVRERVEAGMLQLVIAKYVLETGQVEILS
jgi:carbonic anhydrase